MAKGYGIATSRAVSKPETLAKDASRAAGNIETVERPGSAARRRRRFAGGEYA